MSEPIQMHSEAPDIYKLKSELLTHPDGPALFEDTHFPTADTILFSKKNSEFNEIKWRRPGQLSETPYLFKTNGDNSVSYHEGKFTPFWFPILVSFLRERKLYEQVMPNSSSQNTFNQEPSPITPVSMSYCGAFQFSFRRGGIVEYVIIDDRLPTKVNCEMLSAYSSDPNEFFPALLEKAYAKFLGGYYNLERETFLTAVMDFTGSIAESLTRDMEDKITAAEIDEFYQKLLNMTSDSFAICQIISSENNDPDIIHKSKHMPYFIYLITGYTEIPLEPPDGLMKDIVNTVSNSRGNFVPAVRLLPLSYYKENTSIRKNVLHKWQESNTFVKLKYGLERNKIKENWITVEKLLPICNDIILYNMLNRNAIIAFAKKLPYWKFDSFESFWSREGPRGPINKAGDDFIKNDQYLFKVDQDEECSIKVVLTNIQKYIDSGANVIQPGYKTEIGITLLEVEKNRRYRVHNIDHTVWRKVRVDFLSGRYFIISANLERGCYVIIPWISDGPGIKYSLQVFSSSSNTETMLLDMDIPKQLLCITCQIKQTAFHTQNKFRSLYTRPSEDLSVQTSRKSSTIEADICQDCKATYPKRATRISVIGAENIVLTNFYVPIFSFKISCENETYESKIVKTPLNPQWNEHFLFYRVSNEDSQATIQLFCENRFGFKTTLLNYTFCEKELRDKCPIFIPLKESNDEETETNSARLIVEVQNYFPSEFNRA